jgi:hypothetical protein
MRRTKVVLAVAAMMVAMLVAFSAPAMANDKNERNDQHRTTIFDDGNRNDIFHDGNRNDIFHDGNRNDIFDDGNDIFDDGSAFFLFPFFAVEEIDIDCDGEDDDWDGGIDEGADCEVEIEFFEWWD